MALLDAYFDESGTHAGSTITAIAGYVATKETWAALEERWLTEIRLFADKGITAFHMHDCILGEGEYARVEHFHRMAHIKRLSEFLRHADIHALGAYVDNADWQAVVTDPKFLATFATPYDSGMVKGASWRAARCADVHLSPRVQPAHVQDQWGADLVS